ncbi:MAG: hypothetical protein L3K06_01935 [Thermoplasmata archaeon]|nr:hypothetical protein [Thermoplasmata archaeon]
MAWDRYYVVVNLKGRGDPRKSNRTYIQGWYETRTEAETVARRLRAEGKGVYIYHTRK